MRTDLVTSLAPWLSTPNDQGDPPPTDPKGGRDVEKLEPPKPKN
jgi:hypothetical protein